MTLFFRAFRLRRPARGAMIQDSIIGVMVFCALSVMLMTLTVNWLNNLHYQAVANHISRVSLAAEKYILDNYEIYVCQLAPTHCAPPPTPLPLPFTAQTLVNAGYLDSGMGTTTTDRQAYSIGVRARTLSGVAKPMLEALLITTGGETLDGGAVRSIAALINGAGGFISDPALVSMGGQANTAYGTELGWALPVSPFGMSAQAGHLAVALAGGVTGLSSQESDRLYRFKSDAHPEYNQMHTDIDMNGNSVNNAEQLNANEARIARYVAMEKTGWFGWRDGEDRKAWMQWNSDRKRAELKSASLAVDNDISAGGMIIAGTYTMPGKTVSAGDSCTAEALGISAQMTDTNGLLAHDSTGGTLSCQSGVWKRKSLERMTWYANAPGDYHGRDYGDICHAQLASSGNAASGWVATGADACSEDEEFCTIDGIRCFAVRLN